MRNHLESFLDQLRLNRNASRHTVAAYRSDLSQFLSFLEDFTSRRRLMPADLDHRGVRAFLGELYRRGTAGASSARKLAAIRSFTRYLRREGQLEHDPGALVATPRIQRKIPPHLDIDEVRELLEAPDRATPLGRRDSAILELFYASGLRLSELVGLDLEDINLSGRFLRVRGKGVRSGWSRAIGRRRPRSEPTSRIDRFSWPQRPRRSGERPTSHGRPSRSL